MLTLILKTQAFLTSVPCIQVLFKIIIFWYSTYKHPFVSLVHPAPHCPTCSISCLFFLCQTSFLHIHVRTSIPIIKFRHVPNAYYSNTLYNPFWPVYVSFNLKIVNVFVLHVYKFQILQVSRRLPPPHYPTSSIYCLFFSGALSDLFNILSTSTNYTVPSVPTRIIQTPLLPCASCLSP